VLQEMLTGTVTNLLRLRFNEPAKDELTIRQHSFLSGQQELLEQLLRDNYPPPELPLTESDQQQQNQLDQPGEFS